MFSTGRQRLTAFGAGIKKEREGGKERKELH